jgi:hypothetical protein
MTKITGVHIDPLLPYPASRTYARYLTKRINHTEAYSMDGVCTNQAESFFSRLRRAENSECATISLAPNLMPMPTKWRGVRTPAVAATAGFTSLWPMPPFVIRCPASGRAIDSGRRNQLPKPLQDQASANRGSFLPVKAIGLQSFLNDFNSFKRKRNRKLWRFAFFAIPRDNVIAM